MANEDLRHIRKGLYWRGIKTPLGIASPSPAALAARFAGGRGIGPSGLSAASALRMSTQIPRRAEYAVVDRPPANSDVVRFVARSSRRGRAVHDLGPLDIAALEVLDGWDQLIEVGPNEAMGHLTRLIQSGTLTPSVSPGLAGRNRDPLVRVFVTCSVARGGKISPMRCRRRIRAPSPRHSLA